MSKKKKPCSKCPEKKCKDCPERDKKKDKRSQ